MDQIKNTAKNLSQNFNQNLTNSYQLHKTHKTTPDMNKSLGGCDVVPSKIDRYTRTIVYI